MARPKTPKDENETRKQLMQATLKVIASKGIAGATARAIAGQAKVNQALVFYYFGSVTNLIISAVEEMSMKRYKPYEEALAKGTTIQELAEIFVKVFEDDRKTNSFQILSQFVSEAKSNEDIARAAGPIFTKWISLTRDSLERVLGVAELPNNITLDDIALAIMSGLLGVQFMAMIPEYEQPVSELIAKSQGLSPILALLPMILGNK